MFDPKIGILNEDLAKWLAFNVEAARGDRAHIAPLPPKDRIHITSGLTDPADFAVHGQLITSALAPCLPLPFRAYRSIVDFGVGVGRLARMFKGYPGTYLGLDIDAESIAWVTENLDYVSAIRLIPNRRIPLGNGQFPLIISVSVFSHMNESSATFYIGELLRLIEPGGTILVTTHGVRALARARSELEIRSMLSLTDTQLLAAERGMQEAGFSFVDMNTHLTSAEYSYGITFHTDDFVRRICCEFGANVEVRLFDGQIADFQDVIRIDKLA